MTFYYVVRFHPVNKQNSSSSNEVIPAQIHYNDVVASAHLMITYSTIIWTSFKLMVILVRSNAII